MGTPKIQYLIAFFFFSVSITIASGQQLSQKAFRNVNSAYDEQSPVISPDGKLLYWTVANHPDNIGGKKDPGDIWYSIWTGDEWSFPQHADKVLNDEGYNAVAGFSNDGERMFLVSHYQKGTELVTTQGMSVSLKTTEGWSKPGKYYNSLLFEQVGNVWLFINGNRSVCFFS